MSLFQFSCMILVKNTGYTNLDKQNYRLCQLFTWQCCFDGLIQHTSSVNVLFNVLLNFTVKVQIYNFNHVKLVSCSLKRHLHHFYTEKFKCQMGKHPYVCELVITITISQIQKRPWTCECELTYNNFTDSEKGFYSLIT